MSAYDKLMIKVKEPLLIELAEGLLHWDLETYMPPKGIEQRGEELAFLAELEHKFSTSKEMGSLLIEAEKEDLDEIQHRNVAIFRKEFDKNTKVPGELVANIARQQAITVTTWKKAKAAKDWKKFEPELSKLMDLVKEQAEIYKEVKGTATLYDALLDEFEPNMPETIIADVFNEMREPLVKLSKKCVDASSDVDQKLFEKHVPIEIQKKIAADLCSIITYDISSDNAGGRIDETEHPFTGGYYDDVRITVNYHENDAPSAIFAILHEGGHALYGQNLNPEWKYQPLGEASSYGIHESQSRFVENMIGRTTEFWEYYLPRLNKFTDNMFGKLQLLDFVKAINLVKPSKIRIEADEVTYSLHVIIRFEIERKLWADKIEVSELPQVWNEMYEKYLGVEIKDDAEGVMQDTHWASGLFGYFPSYALGNVYGGQMLGQLNKDVPNWRTAVSKGNLKPAINWLSENVHFHSKFYDPLDLVKKITGSGLSSKPFLEYLEGKYSALFGF
jgi:carboxypeptidase Taq